MAKETRWWKQHYRLAKKTEGKKEGLGIREEMARTYFDEGRYEEAAVMWDEMAKIAAKYPATENEAPTYALKAKKIRARLGRDTQGSDLEAGVAATVAIIGLVGGMLFLSPNVTGNAAGTTASVSNILGAVLLVAGLIGSFFWLRSH